jgi:O-succinylbenzoic acid--CoA ligase
LTTPAALPDWLAHRAGTTPERIALVAGRHSWSFAQLDADVTRTARRLATLGVRAGDRVATLLHNGPAPVILAHAVLRLGATLVPLNTRLGEDEIAWQIGDAAPRVLVVDGRTEAAIGRAVREHPDLVVVSLGAGDGAPGGAVFPGREASDAALRLVHALDHQLAIIYTSGTTGRPKGAILTAGSFWWSTIGSALNLGTRTDDRWLACLPLFHVGGLSIALRSAIYGITAVVHDGFDATAVNRAIDDEHVTIVSVVTVMLQRMLEERDGRPYPPTLRCVLLGGGPAPASLLEQCASLGIPVAQTYGLTETCSQVATLAPEDAIRKLGSAGKVVYPNELRIEPHGAAIATDGSGEILVRGPIVMAGYWGRPDETARAIVGGWLHTGDVGRLDEDGFLYVLDRREDLIVTGGENVYPAEVEAALLSHPQVLEAGVVGVADERWGKRVVAIVRLSGKEPATPIADLLRTHCRERLAAYKVPAEIRVAVEPLPRTASGKLRRGALRELLGAR